MADAHATVRLARRLRSMPATAAALAAGATPRGPTPTPGDAGRPSNGAACPLHRLQGDHRRVGTDEPGPAGDEERIARVELLRRRIADNVRHDPAWSTD